MQTLRLCTILLAAAAIPGAAGFRLQRPRPATSPRLMMATAAASQGSLINALDGATKEQRVLFVGGKGGVGKTSTSAALSIAMADSGLDTLVISTDPAHSLSDALSQDVGGGKPILVQGTQNLYGLEVDADGAVREFQEALAAFDATALAASLGVPANIVESLGIDDLAALLTTAPPGLDELVALAAVVDAANEARFERVVIDTAPTGHTLRLLALPDFLDNLLDKLLSLKERLRGLTGKLGALLSMVGGGAATSPADLSAKLDAAAEKLQKWRDKIAYVDELLHDPSRTQFLVVTIATQLAVAESKRLKDELREGGIRSDQVIVNRLLPPELDPEKYLSTLTDTQQAVLARLEASLGSQAALTKVPLFDTETRGVFGLRYFGQTAFASGFEDLKELPAAGKGRFVLVGGKGGVGKTTSSASLAVALADAGQNVAIVSTDPAHSLADALQLPSSETSSWSGAGVSRPVEVPGCELGGGRLFALEVDPSQAIGEFKNLIQKLGDRLGADELLSQLGVGDFADLLDAAPPGTDELIALAQIVSLFEGSGDLPALDAVIVDTAPTGHTLRLLAFPDFLDGFLDKLRKIRDRLKSAAPLLSMMGISVPSSDDAGTGADELQEFQNKMNTLDSLLHDSSRTEFVSVSIATTLSAEETLRLQKALTGQGIVNKRVIVNQLIDGVKDAASYVETVRSGQLSAIDSMSGSGMELIKLPYYEYELTGIYGLRALGADIAKEIGLQ